MAPLNDRIGNFAAWQLLAVVRHLRSAAFDPSLLSGDQRSGLSWTVLVVYVYSSSQSSPSIHLSADSLPFSMPHSKSVQGPTFCLPRCFSVARAALSAPFQISSMIVCWLSRLPFSQVARSTILILPFSMRWARFMCRLYQICRVRVSTAFSISVRLRGSCDHSCSHMKCVTLIGSIRRRHSAKLMKYIDLMRENEAAMSA